MTAALIILVLLVLVAVIVGVAVSQGQDRQPTRRPLSTSSGRHRDGWVWHDGATDAERPYWTFLAKIREHKRSHNEVAMLDYCKKSIPYLKALVQEQKREFGEYQSLGIPALEEGCRCWTNRGDLQTLQWVRQTILAIPELKRDWLDRIDEAIAYVNETLTLRQRLLPFFQQNPGFPQSNEAIRQVEAHQEILEKLLPFLRQNPGFPQNRLRQAIGVAVKQISGLLRCLEQEGYLRREKADRTYHLYLCE